MQYQHPSAGTNLSGMYDTPAAAFYPLAPQSEGGGWVRSRLCKNPLADLTSRGYNTVLQRTLFADLTIDQNLEMITPGLSAQVRVAYDNSAEITDMRTCDFAYHGGVLRQRRDWQCQGTPLYTLRKQQKHGVQQQTFDLDKSDVGLGQNFV